MPREKGIAFAVEVPDGFGSRNEVLFRIDLARQPGAYSGSRNPSIP